MVYKTTDSEEVREKQLSHQTHPSSLSLASLHPMMSLCCVLKRDLVNGVIVYSEERMAAAASALARAYVCAWECVCVLMVIRWILMTYPLSFMSVHVGQQQNNLALR